MNERRARASRENGKKGGRPPKPREPNLDDFDSFGPPPIDNPLKLARWCQSILATDMWRQINGRADDELSQELRATAAVINRTIPADIIAEAEKLIRDDNQQLDVGYDVPLDPVDAKNERIQPLSRPAARS